MPHSALPIFSRTISSILFLFTFSILVIFTYFSTQTQILCDNFNTAFRDTSLDDVRKIPIIGAVGPESFAFDPSGGGPYTGVSDGRIIKWLPHESRWIDFAVTTSEREGCENPDNQEDREPVCGRPLGLCFNKQTGDLYIADAYFGLLVVGPEGGLAQKVVSEAEGVPFKFTNGLDIDQTSGVIYFTDSSSIYQRREHDLVVYNGDDTGRLMRYDPQTNETKVLLHNLTLPNGISLNKENDFLLLVDTTNRRIMKLWLKNTTISKVEVLATVTGYPDNIKRNERGEYWVGVAEKKTFMEPIISKQWIGDALVKLPFDIKEAYNYVSRARGGGYGVRISEYGEVLEELDNESWDSVSEVYEREGVLFIGSITMPYVGLIERKVVLRKNNTLP